MMLFKVAFVFAAILCLCNARPQEDLTDEEREELEALGHAFADFFDVMCKSIDAIIGSLIALMESTPEDGAIIEWNIKEFKDLEEDIIQLKKIDADIAENLIDGPFEKEDHHFILPIEAKEVPHTQLEEPISA